MSTKRPINDLPCECKKLGWETTCRAAFHDLKPQDPEKFVDKNGKKIVHGDRLKYVNPYNPNRLQPYHIAQMIGGDCWIKPFGKLPRRARGSDRSRGRWQGDRWEIISAPSSKQ